MKRLLSAILLLIACGVEQDRQPAMPAVEMTQCFEDFAEDKRQAASVWCIWDECPIVYPNEPDLDLPCGYETSTTSWRSCGWWHCCYRALCTHTFVWETCDDHGHWLYTGTTEGECQW